MAVTVDVDRLALSCLLGSFEGHTAPGWLLDRVRDGLGGVVLFGSNVRDDAQVRDLVAGLRAARADVLIAIDEEGGDVTRLDVADGSDVPGPLALGALDREDVTRDVAAHLGRRLAMLGIDLDLAPCADVNTNPANPIIGVRAFSGDPAVAARHVCAFVQGLQASGVGACIKHFPGHGDTAHDTHLGTARLDAPLDVLRGRELVPFVAAIRAGTRAVMTTHLVAAALDDQPATVSAPWMQLLRDELGFDGLIVSDALDMAGVSGDGTPAAIADAAVRSLEAGVDLLCLGSAFDAQRTDLVRATVAAAIRAGRLDAGRLAASAQRIAATVAAARAIDQVADRAIVPASDVDLLDVAEACLDVDGPLPSRPGVVVECRPGPTIAAGTVGWGLLRHLPPSTGWTGVTIESGDDPRELAVPDDVPLVVVVRDLAVHRWQQAVLERCAALRPHDLVVVELGFPGPARPPAATYVRTRGAARSLTAALARRLTDPRTRRA